MARKRSRQAALLMAGGSSLVLAAFWVWRLGARDQIAQLTTPHLLALLALTVLPAGAWWSWRLDRAMGEGSRDGAR
jgi:hypothetical protein